MTHLKGPFALLCALRVLLLIILLHFLLDPPLSLVAMSADSIGVTKSGLDDLAWLYPGAGVADLTAVFALGSN